LRKSDMRFPVGVADCCPVWILSRSMPKPRRRTTSTCSGGRRPRDEAARRQRADLRASQERANCVPVEPGDRHWPIFERLCRETDTTGSRVSDAWFAALAIGHGCEWVTLDRDFARFPGLKWSVPG